MDLTSQVRKEAYRLGADLVGIAPVERFQKAPLRMSPQGLLPEAQSVIVVAIHHPDAAVELGGEPGPHEAGPYNIQGIMNWLLDDISFSLACFLEKKGYPSLPLAASNIWRYKGYKDLQVDFAPDLAHRYAAVAAGLGEIGWNGLLLTPQFGPRQRVVSVITTACLQPSPMYDGVPLCDHCFACVKNCPTDAFRKEVSGICEIEIGGKKFRFPETNKWRCAWAENFCLNLQLPLPEKINEEVILKHLEKYGWRAGEEGYCLKFCMVPEKRWFDHSYSRSPRRKREKLEKKPEQLLQKIKAIFHSYRLGALAVNNLDVFQRKDLVHPEYHLPDAVSVISLGLRLPQGVEKSKEWETACYRRLAYAGFQMSRVLESYGYSALSSSRIDSVLVASCCGLLQPGGEYLTVLTSAEIKPAVIRRKSEKFKLSPDSLRKICYRFGADRVGFFSSNRYQKFFQAFQKLASDWKERPAVTDRAFLYCPYSPRMETEKLRLKDLTEHLPQPRSVIVLSLHFPHASLDTCKTTPAETTGPFAFVQCETLLKLGDIASLVAEVLLENGYQATVTFDLTGLASLTCNPRHLIVDMRANLWPAVLSGLAWPGLHGHPLSPEYGVRQRFVALVTDAVLPDDNLLPGEGPCFSCCQPCRKHCPTEAIKQTTKTISIEGKKFLLPEIDDFACDWAKRYCLAGKEGSAYLGLDVNLPVPEEKSAQQIAEAVSTVRWGVQKRLLNIAEECLRVCPYHGEKE